MISKQINKYIYTDQQRSTVVNIHFKVELLPHTQNYVSLAPSSGTKQELLSLILFDPLLLTLSNKSLLLQ